MSSALVMSQHDGHVGVIHLRTSKSRIPIRVFYPSKNHGESGNAVGWFANGLRFFADGYLHFLFGIPINGLILTLPLISWLISFFAWFAPLILVSATKKLPKCSAGAEPSTETSPLIVYSHGLTGSGDEHGILFAYWAQRGYIVACIHHCGRQSASHPIHQMTLLHSYEPLIFGGDDGDALLSSSPSLSPFLFRACAVASFC